MSSEGGAHARKAEEVLATVYADRYHNRTTASGVRLNMNDPSMIAHLDLPMYTKVRITNRINGMVLEACVLDRGPTRDAFKQHGAKVDLTRAGVHALGFATTGVYKDLQLEVTGTCAGSLIS